MWAYGRPAPARFWLRMAISEVCAHAWDAASAVGHPDPIGVDIAVEAIDHFGTFLEHRGQPSFLPPWTPPAQPLALVATDAHVSWILRRDGAGVVCEREAPRGGCVKVRAPARSLYLGWFGRHGGSGVRIEGDPKVFQAWRSDH